MTKQVTPAAIRRWGKHNAWQLTDKQKETVERAALSVDLAMHNKTAIRKSPRIQKAVAADLQAFADLAGRVK